MALKERIQIFKESPVWNQYSRWFMIPQMTLNELFLDGFEFEYDPEQETDCDVLYEAHLWAYKTYGMNTVIVSTLPGRYDKEARQVVKGQ